jgi:hypothetical protein
MFSKRTHLILPAILSIILAVAYDARGDIIPLFYGGYSVSANRYASNVDYTAADGLNIETGRVQIHGYYGDDYPYQIYAEAEVIGRANLDASNLFSFMAYSYAEDLETYASSGAGAIVTLGYQDIIRYTGPGSPPPSILLSFHLDGSLSFDPYPVVPNYGQSSVGLGYSFARYGIDSQGYYPSMGNTVPPGSVNFDIGGPTPGVPEYAIDQTFSTTLDYSDSLGGYAFNLNVYAYANVFSSERSGAASADFLHTVSLTGLALGNGGPADLGQFTFDSGLQLAAVPEQSSLVMAGTGVLGLLGYGWRRRRATRA